MNTLPSLFVSHGAPTFALAPGAAGAALAALGRELPRPAGIVVVSPHWMTRGLTVGAAAQPATIHDFGGFPRALYGLQYPARGDAALARRVADCLAAKGASAVLDEARGLDHGVWVPLMHLYPDADVPVVPLAMPANLESDGAWQLGEALAPLADDGMLVIGSGSLTHNLYDVRFGDTGVETYASAFTEWVAEVAVRGDAALLRQTLARAPHAARAHPTDEHFLPLLVAAGAARGAPARRLAGGIEHAVLAMDSFVFGAA